MVNNPFQMVVLIVLIVAIAGVLKAKYSRPAAAARGADDAENLRMKEEIRMLRDRIAVLERIATDKENSLAQQIEQLRDR